MKRKENILKRKYSKWKGKRIIVKEKEWIKRKDNKWKWRRIDEKEGE